MTYRTIAIAITASGPQRVGAALELYRQLESLDVDARMGGELRADFVGGAAKLRIE